MLLSDQMQQKWFIFNLILIVVWIWFFRRVRYKSQNPSRFDVRRGQTRFSNDEQRGGGEIRSLQVFFQYRGDQYEAYKVLGITPGSSLQKINGAMEVLRKMSKPQDLPLLEAAYETLKRT